MTTIKLYTDRVAMLLSEQGVGKRTTIRRKLNRYIKELTEQAECKQKDKDS